MSIGSYIFSLFQSTKEKTFLWRLSSDLLLDQAVLRAAKEADTPNPAPP
jgi:hypothetical protein